MEIGIIVTTLILSGFFSGIEIAFISSNKLQLELDKGSEKISSKIISFFSRNESNFITTMLIGNNISLVIYGIAMTKLLTPMLEQFWFDAYSLLLFQTIISTTIILMSFPKDLIQLSILFSLLKDVIIAVIFLLSILCVID